MTNTKELDTRAIELKFGNFKKNCNDKCRILYAKPEGDCCHDVACPTLIPAKEFREAQK